MAIDFMVMPLSRYVVGDFITPVMGHAWEQGLPYGIVTAEGSCQLPKDVLFGGPDAPVLRQGALPMLAEDLAALRLPLWDEATTAEPRFHRVDPASYGVLMEAASVQKTFFGLFNRTVITHLTAGVFLPCDFEKPFDMTAPVEQQAGSVPRALAELESRKWPEAAQSAVATLRDALKDAAELKLSMVVDY